MKVPVKTRRRMRQARGKAILWLIFQARRIARLLSRKSLYHRLLAALVARTGLFDRDYYLAANADVAAAGIDPLRHYVAYGDREGRAPMPLFDPVHYRSQLPGHHKKHNALLHYVHLGRFQSVTPSPWFDLKYYLKHNKDVARANVEPLSHYLRFGGREGRSPNPAFDGGYYLRNHPELLDSGENPLLHYLRVGRYQGAATCEFPGDDQDLPAAADCGRPTAPPAESWPGLSPRAGADEPTVDVVVPVYRGTAETLRCLHSVLSAACTTAFELVVIDDASPEPELQGELARLSRRQLFTLLVNEENLGFVQTVNRGMALHPDRDVVLLNADTEVYDGWLDRLRQAAGRNPRTGTVTPLSNNATVCSYPRFDQDNPYPLELGYPELDALAARVNAGIEVEMPTAIGFCMYIKRACLAEVGLFDARRFGKGYGEENDFCQRAIGRGWRHIAAADVFVRHWGSASFRGEKAKRVHDALKILDRLHPDYHKDVARFVRNDPLKEARARLDRARLQRLRQDRNVLIVCHNRGGGSERHVQEDIAALARAGHNVVLLRPVDKQPALAFVRHPVARPLPNLPAWPLTDTAGLAALLRDLGITDMHTHGLVDFIPEAAICLVEVKTALGLRLEVNLHDYKVICPRINLVDGDGFYCGEPDEAGCDSCLVRHGSDFRVFDIRRWRDIHKQALLAAEAVLVPDEDMAERLARYFPEVRFEVSPHETIEPESLPRQSPRPAPGERLRVVVIGAISRIKGYDVLLACARDAQARKLPIDFIVMGYSMNDQPLQAAGVRVTGRYLEANAQELLASLSPHLVWLPSVWPETYSYTLSIALRVGLPVVAFDIGAIARRLREYGPQVDSCLLPLAAAGEPRTINHAFMQYS